MKNCIALYRWMIVAWLLLGWLPVSAQTESVFGKSSMTNDQWTMTNMQYQTANAPAYQFRSTSPYSAMVNNTSTVGMSSQVPSRPRKGPWDPPEDNPIGVLPDPAPVGDTMPLLLMAWLFSMAVFLRRKRNRRV